MSVPDTAVATRQNTAPLVRDAVPADYPAIRDVVIAAYRRYAGLIASDIFLPYLADLLDLDTHVARGLGGLGIDGGAGEDRDAETGSFSRLLLQAEQVDQQDTQQRAARTKGARR